MKNKSFAITVSRLLIFFFLLFLGAIKNPLHAQNFKQTLQWNDDPNVLEYEIEIQDSTGKVIQTVTTENNFIDVSLKEGSYKYRIKAYDLLGRESVSTNWIHFDIALAKRPEVAHKKELEALSEDGKTLEIDVSVEDVTSDTLAELVNINTKDKIRGKLILSESTGVSVSETHKANKARFTDVAEGKWKLVITNPSGYSTESEAFEVRDVIKEEKIAAQKAEEERIAREKAEREEKERLEQERLKREEEERLAREKAELEEKERLERERLQREEEERLAREEAERQEAERLAREEAERIAREEEERLEAERLAKLEEKEAKKNKPAAGLEIKAGFDVEMNLFNSELLTNENAYNKSNNEFLQKILPSINVAIAFVPDLQKRFIPGVEVSGNFFYWTHSMSFNRAFEYENKFFVYNLQTSFIGQIQIVPRIFFLDLRAGGGVVFIRMITNYDFGRNSSESGFIYPKLNAGLSLKLIPTKHLVFELGADYNITLTNKVYFTYLLPYFEVGVRF